MCEWVGIRVVHGWMGGGGWVGGCMGMVMSVYRLVGIRMVGWVAGWMGVRVDG